MTTFAEFIKWLPYMVVSIFVWWVAWTCLDAWFGKKLSAFITRSKRKIKKHKKPGRKKKQ